jgi:phage terminase large subunit-like protein
VQKVLSRILPSREQIERLGLNRDQLIQLNEKKKELIEHINSDPVQFFQPSPGGQYDFMTCDDPNIQGLYFFAGNKTGKTTAAAILVGERAAGAPLWGRDSRAYLSRTPARICVFCEDFSTHDETIVPTYLSWMPKRLLTSRPVERGPSGNIVKIHHANGSVIFLRTYEQGFAKAEGKDYDFVWCDEPPPRDIYTAIFRGLVAKRGRLIIAATLLTETWLYDEMSQPFVKVFEASIYDNPWLDEQGRRNYELMLSDDERAIRIYGKPSNLSGAIYPAFRDHSPYVIEQQERLWDPLTERPYPVVLGVDPHERKPIYCEWGFLTPENRVIWFDWFLVPSGPLTEVFKTIKEREHTHTAPTTLVVMDPNRGKAKQIDGKSWMEEFEEHDYPVVLGIDDLNFGHTQLREALLYSEDHPPMMQWMEACRGKFGPIYQMLRYTWEDWSRGSRFEKDVKEKPRQKNKDFPDIHRYVAAAHLDFELLTGRDRGILDIAPGGVGRGGSYIN